MGTVCSRWILGLVSTALGIVATGCNNKDPETVECPAGYLYLRVEPDRDKFVCTKAPQAECAEGFVPVADEDGTYVCMKPQQCDGGQIPLQQENGTYLCLAPTDISCGDGKVAVQADNGTFACLERTKISCTEKEVPVEAADGTFVCRKPVDIDCAEGDVPVRGDDGVYACVAPVSISCPEGQVPVAGPDGTYACKSPLQIACEAGSVAAVQTDGTYACVGLAEIACEEGFVVAQAADGTYSCVEVQAEDVTPGSVTCPSGTIVNGEGTACVQINAIECADDFQPEYNAVSGAWECIDAQAGDSIHVVVDGVVVDGETEQPIEGVLVTIMGLEDDDGETIEVETDGAGYFRAQGRAGGGGVTAIFALEGYLPLSLPHPFDQGVDTAEDITRPEDVTLTGEGDGPIHLVPIPATNLIVAGTVLAGGQAAADVDVQLRATDTGVLTPTAAQTVTTNDEGRFVFEPVPDGVYEVVVSQYDENEDGLPDFQVNTWNCGEALLSACGEPIGNLRLFLQPYFEGELVSTSLLDANGVVVPEQAFTALLGGLFTLPAASDDIVFQLSDPLAADSLTFELWAVDGGNDVRQLPAEATFSSDNLVLTINPEEDLTADANPATQYELRIRALSWQNGEYVVAPTAATPGRVFFEVKAPSAYLANPADLALFWGDEPNAVTGSIDRDQAHWLTSSGLVVRSDAFAAQTTQLSWSLVDGAEAYRLLARWSDDFGNLASQSWTTVKEFPAFGDDSSGTTAWGTLPLDQVLVAAGWDALDYSRQVELALVSRNVDGEYSPVAPDGTLVIGDETRLGLADATLATDESLDSLARGLALTLDFGEEVDTGFVPELLPLAATVTVRGSVDWEWDDPVDPWQQQGTADLVIHDGRFDVCATSGATPPAGADAFDLEGDAGLFAPEDQLITFTAGAPLRNEGQAMTVSSVVETDTVHRVFLEDGLSVDATADADDDGMGTWVCVDEDLPALTAQVDTVGSGDTETWVTVGAGEANGFVVGRAVYFVPTNDDPVVIRSVLGVDTGGNRIAFEGELSASEGTRLVRVGTGAFRSAELVPIERPASVSGAAATLRLDLAQTSLSALGLGVGDVLLVDIDNDWITADDRYQARVTALEVVFDDADTPADDYREEVRIGDLPIDAAIEPSSLVMLVGSAMTVSTLAEAADSSGNVPATTHYDQFAICAEDVADSEDRPVCTTGEALVF